MHGQYPRGSGITLLARQLLVHIIAHHAAPEKCAIRAFVALKTLHILSNALHTHFQSTSPPPIILTTIYSSSSLVGALVEAGAAVARAREHLAPLPRLPVALLNPGQH
eukprot:1030825-Prorocentrum_minimum.AAC.2